MKEQQEKVQDDLALLYKDGEYGVLAMAATSEGGAVLQISEREEKSRVAVFDNYFDVVECFDLSVDTSVENGWKCFHRGARNWG